MLQQHLCVLIKQAIEKTNDVSVAVSIMKTLFNDIYIKYSTNKTDDQWEFFLNYDLHNFVSDISLSPDWQTLECNEISEKRKILAEKIRLLKRYHENKF